MIRVQASLKCDIRDFTLNKTKKKPSMNCYLFPLRIDMHMGKKGRATGDNSPMSNGVLLKKDPLMTVEHMMDQWNAIA